MPESVISPLAKQSLLFTRLYATGTRTTRDLDGDLLDRTLKEAGYVQHKPFLFQIMTTSNHRPYTFPEGKIDKASGSGRSGAK